MENFLFKIHLFVIIFGVASFLAAFLSSWLYLLRQRQLKKKSLPSKWPKLPSLEELDRWAWRAVWFGFAGLTLGITLGFFLAHVVWPDGWTTDPKVTLSVMAWLWIFATLILRGKFGWRGTRFFIFIVIGFVLTLVIFIGSWVYGGKKLDEKAEFSSGEACTSFYSA